MKLFRFLMCGALLLPGLLLAHGDEDHGATAAAAVASTAQALRMEAASELFELVAALESRRIVLPVRPMPPKA